MGVADRLVRSRPGAKNDVPARCAQDAFLHFGDLDFCHCERIEDAMHVRFLMSQKRGCKGRFIDETFCLQKPCGLMNSSLLTFWPGMTKALAKIWMDAFCQCLRPWARRTPGPPPLRPFYCLSLQARDCSRGHFTRASDLSAHLSGM